ncbi:hypothetical protein GGI22_008090, partial [Coemansia erecta]
DETIASSDSVTNEDDDNSDDDIFVPEGSYAQLDDDEINEANAFCQHSGMQEPGENANFDLARILDERINAELAQRQVQEKEKSKVDETQSQELAPDVDTDHSTVQLTSPIEVDIDSPKQKAMPAEHVQQIKDIMAGIQLSDSAIPEWAERVPEQTWMPRRKKQPAQPSSLGFTDLPDSTADAKDSTP